MIATPKLRKLYVMIVTEIIDAIEELGVDAFWNEVARTLKVSFNGKFWKFSSQNCVLISWN